MAKKNRTTIKFQNHRLLMVYICMARVLFDLSEEFTYDAFKFCGQLFGRVASVQIRHVDKYRSVLIDVQRFKVNVLAQIPADRSTTALARPTAKARFPAAAHLPASRDVQKSGSSAHSTLSPVSIDSGPGHALPGQLPWMSALQ